MHSGFIALPKPIPADINGVVFKHVVALAERDPVTMSKLMCTSKSWYALFVDRGTNNQCSVKQQLCHAIRRAMHKKQSSSLQRVLSFFNIIPAEILELRALLDLTVNHFDALTASDLPKDSRVKKIVGSEITSVNLYYLYLFELGFRKHGTELENIIQSLQNIILTNNAIPSRKLLKTQLQALISVAAPEDNSALTSARISLM